MTTELLLDTDVFIDHLRGFRRLPREVAGASYSVVTRAELFAGRDVDETDLRDLLSPFREVDVTRGIAELGGRLRRHTHLGLADALIAATALEEGRAMVTRNERHYGQVPGLKIRAPSEFGEEA